MKVALRDPRLQQFTVAVVVLEACLLGAFLLLGSGAGESDTGFWLLLFTQYPGILVMSFWEALEGKVPGVVYMTILYAGIFFVQVALLEGGVVLGLRVFRRRDTEISTRRRTGARSGRATR